MILFPDTAKTVADHVLAGRSVRLVGTSGSGRTSVLEEAVRTLESRGVRVRHAAAALGGKHASGYVLDQLDLLGNAHDRGGRAIVGAARAVLLADDEVVLAIDDAEEADPPSAQIIDYFAGRVRTIRVLSPTALTKPAFPEATVKMPTLQFDGVTELLGEVLGGAAATSLVARVLGKSGGIPQLVVAIAESAKMSELLTEEDGIWHLSAPSLWNEHLRPLAQWRLRDTGPEEVALLRRLSQHGPQTLQQLALSDQETTLRQLVRQMLVHVTEAAPGEPLFHVWPPLVADLLSREDSLRPDAAGGSERREPAAGGAEWSFAAPTADDAAAASRVFQQDADEQANRKLADWELSKTADRASAYLLKATGSRFERTAIERVLAQTDTRAAPMKEAFRFEFQRAQWLACDENDLSAGLDALEQFAVNEPRARTMAEAASYLLRAFLDRMPSDFASRLDPDPNTDSSGLVGVTRSLLDLFSGDLEAARQHLPSARSGLLRAFGPSVLLPYIAALEGDPVVAERDATEVRSAAVLAHDRLMYISSSYVAVNAALAAGRVDRAERAIAATLGTGRASMLLRPFFGAIINLSATTAALTTGISTLSTSLIRDAEVYTARPGPLFGTGTDITTIVAKSSRDPRRFDRDIAKALRKRRELGYITAAISSAVLAGAISVGPELANEVRTLREITKIPLYDRPTRVILSLAARDLDDLTRQVRSGGEGDTALVSQIVGAACRRAERESDTAFADALQPLAAQLDRASEGSFAAIRLTFPVTGAELTAREREIATLAGYLTNADIATHLGISVRTVENHIANSMRKLGKNSRSDLSGISF